MIDENQRCSLRLVDLRDVKKGLTNPRQDNSIGVGVYKNVWLFLLGVTVQV
jgi:hypothetical protein